MSKFAICFDKNNFPTFKSMANIFITRVSSCTKIQYKQEIE